MQTTFHGDLETAKSRSCAPAGATTADATRLAVSFRQGDAAHRRELRVVNRKFPNNGGWNFFVAAFSWAARQAAVPAKARHPEAWPALLRMLS